MADVRANVRNTPARVADQTANPNRHEAAVANQTGVHQPIAPNQRRQDANQQGQQGGQQGGETQALAHALKSMSDTGISRAVTRLTNRPMRPAVGPGLDNVLLNVGVYGTHTFAIGSLIPRQYLRLFYKTAMGKRLRVARWLPDDEQASEGEEGSGERIHLTAEEYEQIVREMTLARLNRPMNRDRLANGYYDAV